MEPTARKSLGILQAGRSPEEVREHYPDYNQLFIDLLGEQSFDYRTWAVLDNVFPDSADDADAWLITGSRHGAYEPHSWIPPLEQLIRDIYERGIPMVGICFGHQIIAQALGGTVEKFSGGWSVGRVEYTLAPEIWGNSGADKTPLMAFHQDQITEPPTGALNVGSTSFCKHAALVYDTRILTIQPHPEFDSHFVDSLLDARSDMLPDDVLAQAKDTLNEPLDRITIGETLRNFLNKA
ncbi:MAG: type 1 glutamine amidotransferase [Granulosicoccus sp.]